MLIAHGFCCMRLVHNTNVVFSFQDESSYVAGERAALLRAFRETLPSQQALGSLFHAVQHLTKRMDQEGNDVHQVTHALWLYTPDCPPTTQVTYSHCDA